MVFTKSISAVEWKYKRANKIMLSSKISKGSISASEREKGRMVRHLSSSNRWMLIKPQTKPKKKNKKKKKKKVITKLPPSVIAQGRRASDLTRPRSKKFNSKFNKNSRSANRLAINFPGVTSDNEKIGREVWETMQMILKKPFMDEP